MLIPRIFLVAGIAAALGAVPALAQDKASRQEAQFTGFLARHGDPAATLARERGFHQALLAHDLRWIKAQAKEFQPEITQFVRNAEDLARESPDKIVVMGACHHASFALHEAMARVARQGLPRRMPAQVDEVVPLSTRERFVENMRRCELVKRLPRSERLIGAGLT